MSLTLGEKLRQAREGRGMTISEVAEQTRISTLYIESIEADDYRVLPGGIFNKGFVKSFAKVVGVDEQEALQDYASLISSQGSQPVEDTKTYRPEVLTDDRAGNSNLPTIIIAVVILGLMTAGVLALVNYIQKNPPQPTNANTNASSNAPTNVTANATPTPAPVSTENLRIEVKGVQGPISVSSIVDGKRASGLITPDKPETFEPQQSLRLSYSKSQARNIQLTLNGKQIALPSAPENPRRNAIEFEINKTNAAQILNGGQITFGGNASPQ